MQIVKDCIFLGFKINTDGDCTHEIKKHFLLGRKAMTKLDSVLKSKGIPQHNKSYIWQTHSKHYPQSWKIESISPKVRNKTRVPTLTTTIQHSFGSFGPSNQSRKRNKRNPNWKRRSKTLFLLWLLWPKLPKLCRKVVVRVGTLVLFLTLGEMLSIFHHWG